MARVKVPAKRGRQSRKDLAAGKRRKVIYGIDEIVQPESSRRTRSSSNTQASDHLQIGSKFKSANHRDIYNKRFGSRALANGRIVDFNSLDTCDATFVRKWFENQNLVKFMEEDHPIYPDLVRLFYTHFDFANENKGKITTWVKGVEINLDDKTLGEILGIPAEGAHDYPGKKWSKHKKFDKVRRIRAVLMDEEADREQKPECEELLMQSRLLHLILYYTFISRKGRLSSVTYLDLFVMYCIICKIKVNMPRMIINGMRAAAKSTQGGSLPYAMWLTKVFKWFNVDLKDEAVTKNKNTSISRLTISAHIGYKYDSQTCTWIKRNIRTQNKKNGHSKSSIGKAKDKVKGGVKDKSSVQQQNDKTLFRKSMIESIVVQEMLRVLNPDAFNPDTMEAIREIAKSECDMRLANSRSYTEMRDESDDGSSAPSHPNESSPESSSDSDLNVASNPIMSMMGLEKQIIVTMDR